LLDHALFDVAVVGDENGLRVAQLEPLLARGAHVIAEKPLATTRADLARIKGWAAASRSVLTMLLTMRHDPAYATMRALVAAGAVGTVCHVDVQKSYQLHTRPAWFKDPARLGGIVPYIGVHAVDLARWTTGLDIRQGAALQRRTGATDTGASENHAGLLLELENGATATCRLDYLRPMGAPSHGDDRLRIAGDRGVLEYGLAGKDIALLTDAAPQRLPVRRCPALWPAFHAALAAGGPAPIPAAECFRVTEIVLALRDAAGRMAPV
jgi:predicted dehydrogenase